VVCATSLPSADEVDRGAVVGAADRGYAGLRSRVGCRVRGWYQQLALIFSTREKCVFRCREFRTVVAAWKRVAIAVGGHLDRGVAEARRVARSRAG
jgi:hypothetical protein